MCICRTPLIKWELRLQAQCMYVCERCKRGPKLFNYPSVLSTSSPCYFTCLLLPPLYDDIYFFREGGGGDMPICRPRRCATLSDQSCRLPQIIMKIEIPFVSFSLSRYVFIQSSLRMTFKSKLLLARSMQGRALDLIGYGLRLSALINSLIERHSQVLGRCTDRFVRFVFAKLF